MRLDDKAWTFSVFADAADATAWEKTGGGEEYEIRFVDNQACPWDFKIPVLSIPFLGHVSVQVR